MSQKPIAEQFRRNTAVALIVCFVGLLWLPTLDLCFHLDHTPMPNENRALATFPTLKLVERSIHDFPAGLEAYFRDHFGFRNRLIRLATRWKHDLFKASNTADGLAGQQGWLYYSGDYMMEHFQGLNKFSPKDLQSWKALLEKRRDWLAQRGIKYLFVVPPDKQDVYPEYLPAWLAQRKATNKLDQFMAYMKTNSTVSVLDLRPTLLAGKKSAPTYLLTDTHWNFYGAFLAYQALVEALRYQLPGLREPLSLTNFEQQHIHSGAGDVAKLLGEVKLHVESNAVAFSPRPPLDQPVTKPADDRLRKKWKPLTNPVATEYPGAEGKAVIFHDSFACAWYYFLGYHFHEVLYIWQYDWDAPLLEREKPEVVIDEILERFFDIANPAELMQKDALP